jgi:hypothetical protein
VDGRNIIYFNDAEMEFLRTPTKCVNDGGGNGLVFIVTASGKRIHNCPVGNPDKKTFQLELETGLQAWVALPASERKPGAVQVGERPAIDPKRTTQLPPEGCLIVRVYNRQFGRNAQGELRYTVLDDYVDWVRKSGWGHARLREPADDYMWVPRPEWQALMPGRPQKGQRVRVPATLCERLIRFHLDPARGMCEWMNFTQLKPTAEVIQLTLTVEEMAASEVRMRLEGSANLREDRGPGMGGLIIYQPRLLGYLAYDPARKVFTRFDIVALGNVKGQPADENQVGDRPGSNPLGIAFELVTNPKPADRVCPRGQRDTGIPDAQSDYYLMLKRPRQ